MCLSVAERLETPNNVMSENCKNGWHAYCSGRNCDCWCHESQLPETSPDESQIVTIPTNSISANCSQGLHTYCSGRDCTCICHTYKASVETVTEEVHITIPTNWISDPCSKGNHSYCTSKLCDCWCHSASGLLIEYPVDCPGGIKCPTCGICNPAG